MTFKLKQHILKLHSKTYLVDFLNKFMKGLNIKDCLTVKATLQADDDIEIIEPPLPQINPPRSEIFRNYLEYCNQKNIEPFKCHVNAVKVYIDYAYAKLKRSASDIKKFVDDLNKEHKVANINTHPLIAHSLSLLKDQSAR